MHELTELIKNDMIPALGVTEPGAIAFAAATARSYVDGAPRKISVSLNSGMYKNAFTCGIPGSPYTGILYAAALGFLAADPEKGLTCLEGITEEDSKAADEMVRAGIVSAKLDGITSRIYIRVLIETEQSAAEVTIRDKHTHITRIVVNGETVFEDGEEKEENGADAAAETETAADALGEEIKLIHRYTLQEILTYIETVPEEEIAFTDEAYRVNYALFEEGVENPKTTFARQLLAMNGNRIFSDDERASAQLLCNAAIEARVIGLDLPAMSITGSGAHGIIATMPILAVCKIRGLSEEKRRRATMLSYLICTYIKEYSGRLSAFCGCGIAAGTGMACAVCWLWGGGLQEIAYTINNMASSITGMICDGGNQGCTMKGVAACSAAFDSAKLALAGVHIENAHGINGNTPEDTMRNMGLIASPGMVATEKTIVDIQQSKSL